MVSKINYLTQKSKRRLVSFKEVQVDLGDVLPSCFNAFHKAAIDFEREIEQTPKEARARGFEASLLNSKVLHRIQEEFPDKWKFGKYGRFILRVNGYNMLIKKLNNKDMPMNIKTKNSEAISNQLSFPLFDDFNMADPIIYFGYKKDKFGNVFDPKLVYIDEGNVCWTMTEDQILSKSEVVIKPAQTNYAEPKLRVVARKNGTSNR